MSGRGGVLASSCQLLLLCLAYSCLPSLPWLLLAVLLLQLLQMVLFFYIYWAHCW